MNIDTNIPLLKIEKQIKPLSIEIHVVCTCKVYTLEAYYKLCINILIYWCLTPILAVSWQNVFGKYEIQIILYIYLTSISRTSFISGRYS